MKPRMRRAIKNFEVLDSVVTHIAVAVMHDLRRCQEATERSLHYETVLAHVSMLRGRMIRTSQEHVAVLVNRSTALPGRVREATELRGIRGHSSYQPVYSRVQLSGYQPALA